MKYLGRQNIAAGKQEEVVYKWQKWQRQMDTQKRAGWTGKGENGHGTHRTKKLVLRTMREVDEVAAWKANVTDLMTSDAEVPKALLRIQGSARRVSAKKAGNRSSSFPGLQVVISCASVDSVI